MSEPPDVKSGTAGALRLRALDQDDLQVVAACLQDALVPLREMAFMADESIVSRGVQSLSVGTAGRSR